jgi:DNA-binding protein Fis
MIGKTIPETDGERLGWSRSLGDQETTQPAASQDVPSVRALALKVLAYALLERIEQLERPREQGEVRNLHLADEVRRFESAMIRSALNITGGRKRPAARLLGMKSTTIHAKIRRYKIDLDEISRQTNGRGRSLKLTGKEDAVPDWHGTVLRG